MKEMTYEPWLTKETERLRERIKELEADFRTFDLGKSQVEAVEKSMRGWKERAFNAEAKYERARELLEEWCKAHKGFNGPPYRRTRALLDGEEKCTDTQKPSSST